MIARDLPVTASLAVGGIVVSAILGVGGGVLAAMRPRSPVDRAVTTISIGFYSTPSFLVGQLLLLLLFFRPYMAGLDIFPPGSHLACGDNPLQ